PEGRVRRPVPRRMIQAGSRAQLPGTPDGDLADADVHARYLAGERAAVTAGDHREVAQEPAVRPDHRDADRVLVGCDLVGGQAAHDAVSHRVRDAVDVRRCHHSLVSLLRGLLSEYSRLAMPRDISAMFPRNYLWAPFRSIPGPLCRQIPYLMLGTVEGKAEVACGLWRRSDRGL